MKQVNRLIPVLWLISIVILALYDAQLPPQVGTHLTFNGEVDNWGPKSHLWILPITMLIIWCLLFLLFKYLPVIEHNIKGKIDGKSHAQRRDVLMITLVIQLTVWVLYTVYLIATMNGIEGIPFWLMWLAYAVIGVTLMIRMVRVVKRK
ncbi:DUF1648 domain-containing protein [Staphylococcus intermedius]|uniref:Predicted membrane protein n=1 Tax=Staphylococcus intermedius NCTC 11048 TaxID=1141106 RepID=A0A380G5P1_STAIN|nr:DUF1648 domain-containing protein [Staphylococcus intermedius]PCF63932.1 hypothetical protein B5C04_08110 [Staphylococcus intermedius]PCF78647.1 hypothetical protein B4W74_08460 [Staphylococcus intermedius]PCF79620.1 hypothetical protein B4W70_08100 [Staphylococcus intermedius]PCF86644.1 hypothetical protein B4W76_06205 [Staphylococcus intermedius]PCF89721.1 hypothetical protein B4W75_02445 [Staphylococcus intermedius]